MHALNLVHDPVTQDATFFIDNSSTERFDTCARSSEYYLINRRESNKDKPALTFGKIMHKLLQHRYNYLDKSVIELMPELIELAQAEFEKYTPPDGDYRNYGTAIDALQEYSIQYPYESFEILNIDGKLANEVPFACPLAVLTINAEVLIQSSEGPVMVYVANLHIVWKGKIDMVIKRGAQHYGMDHKSTSMMGPTFFADFAISGQVYGYSWAIKQLSGIVVDGYTINGLGIRAPTKSGKKLEFKRHTTPIYPELIDEWVHDTTHKIADFIEMARRGYFPKQTKWCAGKYGMCEYHGVCTLAPNMRPLALSTNEFKNVTWDPLKNED